MNTKHAIGKRTKHRAERSSSANPAPAGKLSGKGKALALWLKEHTDMVVLLSVVLLSMLMAFKLLPDSALSDEGFHWPQFEQYFAGNFESVNSITMLPGYHLTVYGISKLLSLRELFELRYVSFALSILSLLFFFLITRQYQDKATAGPVSLQFLLSPLIFPFFFLIYTDIPALTMILASLWLVTKRRYQVAALVIGLSIAVRQINLVWLGLVWVLSLVELGFFSIPSGSGAAVLRHWLKCLLRTCLFPVFCLLFAAFMYINGGVATGDAGNHQAGLHPTQVFLLLFTLFLLFLPLHIANLRKIASLLSAEPLWLFGAAILFAVYIFTFDANHGYNIGDESFLRNKFLALIRDGFMAKALAFIPIVVAFFSIAVTPLRRPGYYWLYPCAIVCVLPVYLIEPRYYIVPIALFALFRKPLDHRFEYLQAALYVPLTVYIFDGIYQRLFFP